MKLQCEKCGRTVDVRAKDIREGGFDADPSWDKEFDSWLPCPFCVRERHGNTYALRRVERRAASKS